MRNLFFVTTTYQENNWKKVIFSIPGWMKMKYKWRRICAITGMIALCLFTPDIAEGNNSQDFESGTEISKERMLDIIQDISAAPRTVKRAL